MKIGSIHIASPVIAAPMAGVSDKPYRKLCRAYGAGMAVSEMVTSQASLRNTQKSKFRHDQQGELEPRVVQIVGTDPMVMAQAAQYNVENGAQIIDINMGCPAKKVCKKLAGSALLSNEQLVADILTTVVKSVDVPVTLKIRTGVNPEQRNATTIAKIAQDSGIQGLAIHGRTRACKFVGQVEYDSMALVKQSLSIPVIANGDICTPEQAKKVLDYTGCDAVMIGRAAQGQPWLLQQIADFLTLGTYQTYLDPQIKRQSILQHIKEVHAFYGEFVGVRLARKHIKWYLHYWPNQIDASLRTQIVSSLCSKTQYQLLETFLNQPTQQIAA